MKPRPRRLGALLPPVAALAVAAVALGLSPTAASARRLNVDLWTDRGDEGVYRPGDRIEISARLSDGAYLLVYEIDAEGYVHVLHPYGRSDAYVEGPATLRLPDDDTDLQLVTEAPAGEGYIVAIASDEPFERMPWYLRPYDAERDEYGDREAEDEQEGVTQEGRIVGDPFVAMERIRREVLADPDEREGFSTAYTSYYVHDRVRYPRYLCYDCHRPGQWRWWDGFDPYYTSCNVFDFRVNVGWWWGPSYWFGTVPYYVYSYRPDCPPGYRHGGATHYSSWDGWRTWRTLWGPLRRYKSAPPTGYLAPAKYDIARRWKETGRNAPPGYLASDHQVRARRGPGFGRTATDPGGTNDRGGRREFSGPKPGVTRQDGQGRARRGGFDIVPKQRGDAGDGRGGEPRERKGRGDDGVPRERREREPVDRPVRGRDEQPQQGGKQNPEIRRERPSKSDRAPSRGGKSDRRGSDESRSSSFAPRFDRRVDDPRFDRRAEGPRFAPRAADPRFDRRAAEPRYERRVAAPRFDRRASEPRYSQRAEPRFERRAEPMYDRRAEPRHQPSPQRAEPRFERREAPAPRNDPPPRFEPSREQRRESPPSGASAPPARGWGGGHGRKDKGN